MTPRPYLPIVRMTLGVIVLAIVVGSFYLLWAAFLKPGTPSTNSSPSASPTAFSAQDQLVPPAAANEFSLQAIDDHGTLELQLHFVHA